MPLKKRFRIVEVIVKKPSRKRKVFEFQNLDDKCIESILKYLSLDDLYSMSRTCKRIKKLAGLQFQRMCPNSSVSIEMTDQGTFQTEFEENFDFLFSSSVQKVTMTSYIYDHDPAPLFTHLKQNFCPNLKELHLYRIKCDKRNDLGHSIKAQLTNLKIISFDRCAIADIHKQFLKNCPNLTHLRMKEKGHNVNYGEFWKHNTYPNLDTLTFWGWDEKPCQKLRNFFIFNRSVKNVSCMSVKAIEVILRQVNNLDNVVIYCESPDEFKTIATTLLLNSFKNHFKRFELVFLFNGDFDSEPENCAFIRNLSALPSFQGLHCLFPMETVLDHINIKQMCNLRMLTLKLARENEPTVWELVEHLPLLECVRIYVTYSLDSYGKFNQGFFLCFVQLKDLHFFHIGSQARHLNHSPCLSWHNR